MTSMKKSSFISVSEDQIKHSSKKKNTFLTFIKRTFKTLNKEYFLKALYTAGFGCFAVLFSGLISYFLFPKNIGLFIIILTTLFLMPKIFTQVKYNTLLFGRRKYIENADVGMIEISSALRSSFKINQVYVENSDLIDTFLLYFLGIFITVMLFILIAPSSLSSTVFSSVGWNDSLVPSKVFGFENTDKLLVFKEIFTNNISVLFICFLFAFLFPAAGLLIVVWNAVVWGVVFTQYMLVYSSLYGVSFIMIFSSVFLSAFPHIFLESIGYFLSTISGIVLAFSVRNDLRDLDRFSLVLKYVVVFLAFAILFMVIGTLYELYVYDLIVNIFFIV